MTQEQMYTHTRGAHGRGYVAPCGDWSQWPGKRARHQKKCDQCKELMKMQTYKRFPGTIQKRNERNRDKKH